MMVINTHSISSSNHFIITHTAILTSFFLQTVVLNLSNLMVFCLQA
jgi:hypothetical protein